MAIGEQELAVILQASLEHAQELLGEQGGFLPFGARAWPDGSIEMVEARDDRGLPLDALYRRIGEILAKHAAAGEIVASALVANAGLPEGAEPGFATAVSVLIEAPEFCRAVVVPYRFAGQAGNGGRGKVEFGKMIPEEADPIAFTR
jgi:hypothetical protein